MAMSASPCRALLSQGYLVGETNASGVEGKKNFQPEAESHLQMTIRVVCVPESASGEVSSAFASAVQDRYALKKDNSNASLGVSAIASVSLPFMSGSDSMVKVTSVRLIQSPLPAKPISMRVCRGFGVSTI